jgi:hypothetical protein
LHGANEEIAHLKSMMNGPMEEPGAAILTGMSLPAFGEVVNSANWMDPTDGRRISRRQS